MKQLFCVVVTDPEYVVGLDYPAIFHVECEKKEQAVEAVVVEELSSDENYGYSLEEIDSLDIFTFAVTDLDIIKL